MLQNVSLRAAHGLPGSDQPDHASSARRPRRRRPGLMKATLTVLGSGTSMGVPTIGCDCAVCTSADPHDRRTRPSIMVQWDGRHRLIDTTPDFREQAIREHIRKIDAVLYTHGHADHILGLDDVRPLSFPRVTGGNEDSAVRQRQHHARSAQRFPLHLRGRLQVRRPGAGRTAAGERSHRTFWRDLHCPCRCCMATCRSRPFASAPRRI